MHEKIKNPKECTIHKTIDFISKRWTLLIILELHKKDNSPKRYSEIKKRLPEITPKILSSRLKELTDEKIITKKVDTASIPIKCSYQLTRSGIELIEVIQQFKQWALNNRIKNRFCKESICSQCEI